jgi:exonuclease SbcC
VATLNQQIHQQIHQSPLQEQIQQLEHDLASLDYNLERHNALRTDLRQAQTWQLQYQELTQAKQQYPQVQQRTQELAQTLQRRCQDLEMIESQIADLCQQLTLTTDSSSQIQALEQQIQQRRIYLDQQLAQLGRLQQQQHQLETLKVQQAQQQQQLQTARHQLRVFQELAQAFGKNGIQALMIENVLPQLEAETNQLLARLSANQLHVQFVTQRAGRSSKQNIKLIDTLDILIADAQGTRPYETYSGGEAFRVNFAIRLALARLLAQRSGSDLQMLIIDEGFGTQDFEGCERLIAAINAIAPDFACILTVTHMPTLKEAFQTRIEVMKTELGSQLSLLT